MFFNKSLIPLSAAIFLALDPKYSLTASIFFFTWFQVRKYLIGEDRVVEYEPRGEDVEEYDPESIFETHEIL